jgi:hypothetical protein
VTRLLLVVIGGIIAVYLVIRGIAELFIISYHDPAAYRHDWGGPSLIGVLAVHSGPALLILVAAFVWIRRRKASH